MKQKLKLAFSFYAQNHILLLDEPTSNLDESNIEWYLKSIQELDVTEKVIIICSNQKYEYDFCNEIISLLDYKQASIQ